MSMLLEARCDINSRRAPPTLTAVGLMALFTAMRGLGSTSKVAQMSVAILAQAILAQGC